ncbi:2,3-bisphosphoglycerate-dependent phosphoglycerate mutase [Candidatus Blochmanniella vafra str. BVAF]|uniref:2,3-bisphosphoglycerate-dependent phosphoglycerate mutase n=1 Tax=Blochmanniella vafra (strain BVAF) TaxID=859654 RepID=E8Q6Z1_BLOVB|nr:2,3-diphosphoglycerate-dependent phosphoglycerate mutase [Candidatus Blochmannia vafer]ADV33738.1 2,3-bisphosphoglycerate-dependent phosphoglycerate mutase [Candidatus Blochmannia vafer str. BVAF]
MNINKIQVVFVRHGESEWNKNNRFTGWVDIDLSNRGHLEAKQAGQLLKKNNFIFTYGYTSVLKRAIHTLWIILDQLNQAWLPIKKSWKLNERHYGALQGLNKDEAIKKYGYETIQKWRRNFKDIPPGRVKNKNLITEIDDIHYNIMGIHNLPNGESLELTANRVIPYWKNVIIPDINNNNHTIIIVTHGNSIRAMIKFLNCLSETEISKVEVPTGTPLIYEFNRDFQPIKHYYLS